MSTENKLKLLVDAKIINISAIPKDKEKHK
jgi:hypothetical protein